MIKGQLVTNCKLTALTLAWFSLSYLPRQEIAQTNKGHNEEQILSTKFVF